MVIETALFIALAVIVGAAIEACEGYQDVLYGPYKKRVDSNGGRDDSH
jgi:hypothetical protein